MKRDFNEIISELKNSLATYEYFVDFKKVFNNVKNIELNLNILNYLIGKEDFDKEFRYIVSEHPDVVTVIPILIAVRDKKINIFEYKELIYDFSKYESSADYLTFIKRTGIIDLFHDKRIKNLVDYVTGVEVGLDSNGRKNRSGKIMAGLVLNHLNKIKNIEVIEEATLDKINESFNVDIKNYFSDIKSNKRFDFAVKNKDNHIFLIEVNYYATGGSKLNETSRSYIKLDDDIKKIDGASFIWITDGKGWEITKKNLYDAYESIEHLYTIYDLEKGILDNIFSNKKK